jgi:hypothetical protein
MPSVSERRSQNRRVFPAKTSNPLSARIGVVPRGALVVDVSTHGLGLVTTDPPPVGSLVPVWVASHSGPCSELLLGRITHSEPIDRTLHRIGMAYADEADLVVLRTLYESLSAG